MGTLYAATRIYIYINLADTSITISSHLFRGPSHFFHQTKALLFSASFVLPFRPALDRSAGAAGPAGAAGASAGAAALAAVTVPMPAQAVEGVRGKMDLGFDGIFMGHYYCYYYLMGLHLMGVSAIQWYQWILTEIQRDLAGFNGDTKDSSGDAMDLLKMIVHF